MDHVDQSQAEAAIHQNVKQLEDGWNTKSGALFAKPFADDADFVAANGKRAKGRETIERAHQHLFETIFKVSTIQPAVKQIRFLHPHIALVHVEGHNKTSIESTIREWDFVMTLVMTHKAHRWEITSFHNTVVDDAPSFLRASE